MGQRTVQLVQWEVRLAVLWVALAVGMSAHVIMQFFWPGALEELVEGRVEGAEITTAMQVQSVIFWVVPLLMAFLVLVLRDPVNRFVNAGIGFLVTGMWVWALVESVSAGYIAMALLVAGMVAAGVAILWHAWRWPKTPA